jgi:hypothetical protein
MSREPRIPSSAPVIDPPGDHAGRDERDREQRDEADAEEERERLATRGRRIAGRHRDQHDEQWEEDRWRTAADEANAQSWTKTTSGRSQGTPDS